MDICAAHKHRLAMSHNVELIGRISSYANARSHRPVDCHGWLMKLGTQRNQTIAPYFARFIDHAFAVGNQMW